jgi:hypothetical protein
VKNIFSAPTLEQEEAAPTPVNLTTNIFNNIQTAAKENPDDPAAAYNSLNYTLNNSLTAAPPPPKEEEEGEEGGEEVRKKKKKPLKGKQKERASFFTDL